MAGRESTVRSSATGPREPRFSWISGLVRSLAPEAGLMKPVAGVIARNRCRKNRASSHPVPLPFARGEGARRAGEGAVLLPKWK